MHPTTSPTVPAQAEVRPDATIPPIHVAQQQTVSQLDVGAVAHDAYVSLRELQAHVNATHLLMQLAKARYRGSKSLQDATEAAEWATANDSAQAALLAARRAVAEADHLTMGGEWVSEVGGAVA
jgi:hypothetical protein